MAFTDALVANRDVRVVLVDRRARPGGHWVDAYPYVRLHQASQFYGVASRPFGGRIQTEGPEAGLHERASGAEVLQYYDDVLSALVRSGRVEFHPASEYRDDRSLVSLESGERYRVPDRCRIVDATYLSPEIPVLTPPPFEVSAGAKVMACNDIVQVGETAKRFVVVGSGKTATDTCLWLLERGIAPDDICWVRPREPWMMNRAVVQPNPAIFTAMVADTFEAAAAASSLDDLFLRLESAGIMVRIDRSRVPTMAKAPTIAQWEIDGLRTITNVVRHGHIRRAERGRLVFDDAVVRIPDDAVIVHCAAPGLRYPPLVPIWRREVITVQPVRAGFPCFGAALCGYVEATRVDDADKNRVCPPTPLPDSPPTWARMTVLGTRATMAFGAEPDIQEWADAVALNPARVPRDADADVVAARARIAAAVRPGLDRLARLAQMD